MLVKPVLANLIGFAAIYSTAAKPLLPRSTSTLNPTYSQNLTNQLELATTNIDCLTILKNKGLSDSSFKYNFNLAINPTPGGDTGRGGFGVAANRKNFPALIGLGIAASIDYMNPCGMNTPHTHPRATEFLTIASGGNVKTGYIMEEGLNTQLTTALDQYEGAIFPQGSIHYEFNDSCEPAVFIAAFGSDDPGLSRVAQNFFNLDPNIVDADLGFRIFWIIKF